MVDNSDAPAPQYDWQRKDYRTFELGEVFGRAFRAIGQRAVPLLVISALLVVLPQFLASYMPYLVMQDGFDAASLFSLPVIISSVLVLLATTIIAPAAMVYLLLKAFNNEDVGAMESLRVGLSRFLVLLASGILMGLGMLLGALLFLIPAIILYCGWFVLTPVVVMERVGVTGSLARSWELTRGHKWLVLVVLILMFVLSLVVQAVLTLPFADPFEIDPETFELIPASATQALLAAAAASVAAVVSTVISSALVASTYRELRVVKEGVDGASIADVFS